MEICEILANFTADNINASCTSAEETQMSAWGDHQHQAHHNTTTTTTTKVKQEKADEDETQEYQYQQQQQQHNEMMNEVKLETEEITAAQHPAYFHSFATSAAGAAAATGPNITFDSDCASTPASSASFDSDLAASTSFASHYQQQRTEPPGTPPFKYEHVSSSVSRILNGKFFKITREDSGDNITAVCLKCLPQVVEIKGNKKTTSNFVSHLKRRHGQDTLDEYERWKRQRREDGGPVNRPSHSLQSYYNRKHQEMAGGATTTTYPQQQQQQVQQQQQLHQHQQQLQQQRQQNFNENLVQYAIHSLVPLREVEDPYFKQLFEQVGPDIIVPTRRQLSDEIEKRFERHVTVVTERLQAAKYICTTVDLIWCASEHCLILGVTAHWINAGNLQRQSAALACQRFEQWKKNASPLTPVLLQEILQKYCINQTKLMATITDSGRNFVNHFRQLHVNQEVIMSAAAHAQTQAAIKKKPKVNAEEYDDDNNDDYYDEDDDCTDDDVDVDTDAVVNDDSTAWEATLPNALNGSHFALMVCFNAAFQEALSFNTAFGNLHTQIMAKCNTLWKLAKQPPKAQQKLSKILFGGQAMLRPVETRWNSLTEALKQLWAVRDKMPAAAQTLNIDCPLTTTDFAYIFEYLRCIEPITRALEVLQDDEEHNSYYGVVLPCILSLKHKLEALRNQSWQYCTPLIGSLCKNVSASFNELIGFESAQSRKAVIASLTLPRFKNRWFRLVAPTLHAHLLDILKKEAAAEQNSAAAAQAQTEEPTNVSYKNDDFFDFLTERSEPGDNSLVNTCELEVLKYLSDPDTRLNCLDNYPILRKLFIKYNTPLPSSAPAEKLLPYISMIKMPRSKRSTYNDDMFEKRLILKSKLS